MFKINRGVKGQITVFAILGLVLVIITGLFLFIISDSNVENVDDPTYQNTFAQSQLKTYVESCMRDVAAQGVKKLGASGGYLYPEESGFYYLEGFPHVSNAISLGSTIPYWYHMTSGFSCTECNFELNVPTIIEMQQDLEFYVETGVEGCIDGFSDFSNQYELEIMGAPEVEVRLGNEVYIVLSYPIRVFDENGYAEVNSYEVNLDTNIPRVYELARQILMQFELDAEAKYFEKFTRQIIDYYSIGDDALIPPTDGPVEMEITAPRYWMINEVNDLMTNYLADGLSYVQLLGSEGHSIPSPDNPDASYIDDMALSLYGVSLDDLQQVSVDFEYVPFFPLHLLIDGNSGGVVMPEGGMNTFLIPFALTRYEFDYDVAYPVLVSLEDNDAFSGEGFKFIYAFEVNLKNNNPINGTYELVDPSQNDFFSRARDSGDITITTNFEGSQMENVVIEYDCADEGIFVGQTTSRPLVTKLPICLGGYLSGVKPGYFVESQSLSTSLDQDDNVELNILEEKTISLKVRKKQFEKDYVYENGIATDDFTWSVGNNPQYLDIDENAMLVLERVSSPGEVPFVQVINTNDAEEITLVPGQYKLFATIMYDIGPGHNIEQIVIPDDRMCERTSLNPFADKECFDIPGFTINDTWYVGGVRLDDSTSGNADFSSIDNGDEITVFVLSTHPDDINDYEDLGQINAIDDYSTNYRHMLEPEIS